MKTRFLTLLGLPLSLVACNTAGERADTGECPAGEVCSSATPRGLHFIGTPIADDIITGGGPAATAIGGTQDISLEYDRGNGFLAPLALPYDADDDGGLGVSVVGHTGAVVTVKGVRSRSNYLRIIHPQTAELYDRYSVTGAALKEMKIIGTEFEAPPLDPAGLVFATGDQTIGVALMGDVQRGSGASTERLVDTSMVLDLPGSIRATWDSVRLPNAQVGVHSLVVTAGDRPAATLPIEVVAGADALSLTGGPPTVAPNSSVLVCFQATNAGRYIYGLTWTFQANGVTRTYGKTDLLRNCVSVSSQGVASGTLPVTASAGGRTMSVNVVVGQARAIGGAPISTTAPRTLPTEGDRASL